MKISGTTENCVGVNVAVRTEAFEGAANTAGEAARNKIKPVASILEENRM